MEIWKIFLFWQGFASFLLTPSKSRTCNGLSEVLENTQSEELVRRISVHRLAFSAVPGALLQGQACFYMYS